MDLFRTDKSRKNWKILFAINSIFLMAIAIIGYFFIAPWVLNVTGLVTFMNLWFFHLFVILMDLIISLFIVGLITHFLIFLDAFRKPMKVTQKDKKFTIKKSEEAGRRQKGSSEEED